ncbi:MAG: DNA polymerase III subunit alpha, partial [Rickettsiales bacterium]|nr:DNA polymerase III subunit alpha [Rickettsiales bacterium]
MSANFVHLRLHSEFSIGAGTIKVKKIPELCAAFGMAAVAQTDNNLMCGAAQMSDVCARAGIQPIIGITATLNHHESADAKQLRANMMSQIVLLAQNQIGYENLSRLNSEMYLRRDNMHLGPHITWDELAKYSDGVICLSGAHTGPIGSAVLENQLPLARDFAARLAGIFPNRFYMELQRHGLPNQIKCEPEFLSIARDMNLPIVATNDVCFDRPDGFEAADAYSCILGQSKIIDPDRPKKSSQQYFKSADEMTECFNDLPEAIENTTEIAKRCAFMVNVNMPPLLPRFGDDFDAECKLLRDNVNAGLTKRLADIPPEEHARYRDQAAFECDVIIGMKFPGYFLIVADYIDWCRKNDILVGPGRGSGAGSVVAWSLGITNVNPMAYGLLFERFLNPDRVSMPDFDVDFEPDGIARILEYVREKYGAENVCRIITFGTLQARGTVRDVGRVYGVPYSKTDRFAKLIPMDAKNLSAAVDNTRDIREAMEFDADLDRVVHKAMEIEGLPRNLGQHACGVVIGDRAIAEISPLYRDPGNELPSCQYDGHYLERTGLIKFDFLGLETLAILKYAIQMIQKNHGVFIDLDKIPMDDEKTMELWRRGLTVGVFQYEAPFVRQTLIKMQPTSFANIVALNALNRPGPIAHIPSYIDRMQGRETVKYPHQAAEEILKETYGIIVYQEQVMALSRALAGFTRGESDTLRKGMGKKIAKVMEEMRVKFIDGCEKQNTLNREAAEDLYQQFMKFAEYAFNKSH